MSATTPAPRVAAPARPRRGPVLWRRVTLLGASLALSWILVEGLIHAVEARTGPLFFGGLSNPEYNPDFVRPHPVLGVEHVPHGERGYGFPEHPDGRVVLRSNNLGLREDEDTPAERPDDVYRVLVLGDSQTDGLVYNGESFVNVAETLLNQRWPRPDGRRYELLNAGVITYQPVHYDLWWRTYGRDLRPDLVLAVLYAGNDVVDASRTRVARDAAGRYDIDASPITPPPPSPKQRLLRACRTCVLASLPIRGGPLEGWLAALGLVGAATDNRMLDVHRLCRGCMWQSLNQPYRYHERPGQYAQDIQAVQDVVQQLAGEVRATGAAFGVVMLPSKLEIEGDTTPETAEVAGILGLATYLPPLESRARADLAAGLADRVPGWFDLTPSLERAFRAGRQPLYYAIDWHLNVPGNRAAGEGLAVALGEWLGR